MDNGNKVIVLKLNAVDAALVTACLMASKEMLKGTVNKAIDDGLMPIAQLAKKELKRMENITSSIINTRSFTSTTFELDHEAIAKEMLADMETMSGIIKKQNKVDEPPKEEGKKWEDAGDNVVNILDKLKKGIDNDDNK